MSTVWFSVAMMRLTIGSSNQLGCVMMITWPYSGFLSQAVIASQSPSCSVGTIDVPTTPTMRNTKVKMSMMVTIADTSTDARS